LTLTSNLTHVQHPHATYTYFRFRLHFGKACNCNFNHFLSTILQPRNCKGTVQQHQNCLNSISYSFLLIGRRRRLEVIISYSRISVQDGFYLQDACLCMLPAIKSKRYSLFSSIIGFGLHSMVRTLKVI
jgi:hypothetical protein